MGSVRGFRCGRCRAEVLAMAAPAGSINRMGWTLPLLCCGQPLLALEPDQVLSTMLTRRRVARCSRCGYKLRLVVHPASSLVCMPCQTDLVMIGRNPDQDDQVTAPVAPAPELR
jgi:DNA-directed RNA polymerase subunit RPC12/RpoP